MASQLRLLRLMLRCCLLASLAPILPGYAQGPTRPEATLPAVETLGANTNFAKGDFGSYANLVEFRYRRHLYAVGPVQHLGGEVTVIDSVPYAEQVDEGRLKVTSAWEYQPPVAQGFRSAALNTAHPPWSSFRTITLVDGLIVSDMRRETHGSHSH